MKPNNNSEIGLQQSQNEQLQTYLHDAPIGVLHLAPDGEVVYINLAGLALFDVENDQSSSAPNIYAHVELDSLAPLQNLITKVFEGESGATSCQIKSQKNASRWLNIDATPLLDAQGQVQAIRCLTSDISLQHAAQQSLLECEQRFRILCESNLQQVWIANSEGTLTYVNKRVTDYFDMPLKTIIKIGWNGTLHPDDTNKSKKAWSRAVKAGAQFENTFRIKRADGCYRWFVSKAIPYHNHDGKIIEWLGVNSDITAQKEIEAALLERERRLAEVQAHVKLGSWQYDAHSGKVEWSHEMYRLLDMRPQREPPSFIKLIRAIHPGDRRKFQTKHEDALTRGTQYAVDFRLPHGTTEDCWIEARCTSVLDDAGQVVSLHGTIQDISARKHAEKADQELITASQLLDESQKIAKVGGWELDLISGDLFWTDETYRLHDTTPEEFCPTVDAGIDYYLPESRQILAEAITRAMNEGKSYDLELQTHTVKGRQIDVRTTCTVTMHNDKAIKLTGIFQDISEQKAIQRELESANRELESANSVLEHIAHYDALTHLPNRTLLADRMQQAMLYNQRRKKSVAVAFLDLDGFKEVNDTHGHGVGDELLITIANRLKDALREEDTIARLGGDEFVAVITDLAAPPDCEPLVKRMLEAASKPLTLKGSQVQVSASIGVTVYPQDNGDAEQLLRHADQAMYIAKQIGKNCFHLFDVAKDVAVKTQREELENIRLALQNNEFSLHYQPKVDMQSGDIIGAEALIRWQHPERGLLPPGMFLPVIEEHLLSVDVGEWVITNALSQMQDWMNAGMTIPISVNVSAIQLQQDDFVQRLDAILARFPRVEPQFLELEVLETSALGDITQVSSIMNQCQELGVKFALDDFGTGYSSLTYLKRLPAHILKIDQSFVRDMLDDPDDLAIIRGIIGLANAFQRKVIAEGVETKAHAEKLLSLGCHLAQGYGIAHPMPPGAILPWAKDWQSGNVWLSYRHD